MNTPPQVLSDTFVVEVVPPAVDPEQIEFDPQQEIEAVLDAFVDAIDIGAFHPGQLKNRGTFQSQVAGSTGREFTVANLPESAFAVLRGMFEHYGQVVGPLTFRRAWRNTMPHQDLLLTSANPPSLPSPLPSNVRVDVAGGSGATPPLEVLVEFASTVPDDLRTKIGEDLVVWARLLQGGYAAYEPVGTAALMNPGSRFLDPFTARFFADGWLGHPDGFVPLLALIGHWDQVCAVSQVEISVE